MFAICFQIEDWKQSSSLYFSLREYPLEVLLYAMARIEEQEYSQRIATYIRDLRGIKLEINGDDLVKLGMKQGPKSGSYWMKF